MINSIASKLDHARSEKRLLPLLYFFFFSNSTMTRFNVAKELILKFDNDDVLMVDRTSR